MSFKRLPRYLSYYHCPHSFRKYDTILGFAHRNGYNLISLQQFVTHCPPEPYIILRHDMDTDANAAIHFAQIEHKYNATASYYFRLSTWDDSVIQNPLLKEMEIGYHYEELATYAKCLHLKDPVTIQEHFPQIRAIFSRNLHRLRQRSGLPLRTLASHGDIANVRLNMGNEQFVQDQVLRLENQIDFDAIDTPIMQKYAVHLSDSPYPPYFTPADPQELIQSGRSFLFLTHPRWWRNRPLHNLWHDLKLTWEKARW